MTPFRAHVARWIDCQRCPLKDQRTRVVISRGQLPCDLLMLGEAPGGSEDVYGQPFVGPAGHLLDKIIIDAMPLAYDDGVEMPPTGPKYRVAFTNVVGCFPRDAKESGDGDHRPPVEAIKACAARVKEFVAIARPRIVCCVGDTPKRWVHLGVDTASPRIKVISIIHPAATLGNRMPHAQKRLAIDRAVVTLATALEELGEQGPGEIPG